MLMCADEWHHSLVCWRPHISARCLIITTMIVCVCVFSTLNQICAILSAVNRVNCLFVFFFFFFPLHHSPTTRAHSQPLSLLLAPIYCLPGCCCCCCGYNYLAKMSPGEGESPHCFIIGAQESAFGDCCGGDYS